MARKMNAEFWAVSARTGDGVSELFARAAVLSFQSMVLNECESMKPESINIGSDLISRWCYNLTFNCNYNKNYEICFFQH